MSKIIGYRQISYVNKKTNNPVNGYELFIVHPLFNQNDADGYCWRWQFGQPTRPIFVSVDKWKMICASAKSSVLNTECNVYFDENGRFITVDFKE